MPRSAGFLSLLASFFLALAACSSGEDTKAAPALWKISNPQGDHGYAFGSIHSLPDGIGWLTRRVQDAIGDSDELVLEIDDVADSDALSGIFQSMGRSPGMPSLEERLPRDRWREADKLAKSAALTPAMIAQTETWALALIMASQSTSRAGAESENGVDVKLQKIFEKDGRPIVGLESVQEQFSAFDTLPEQEQRLMLDSAVASAETANEDYAKLVDAWAKGDLKELEAVANDQMLADNPTIRQNLLVNRNRAWASKIGPMLESGRTPFISVGAGHLIGKDNLLSILESEGLTVERIQ